MHRAHVAGVFLGVASLAAGCAAAASDAASTSKRPTSVEARAAPATSSSARTAPAGASLDLGLVWDRRRAIERLDARVDAWMDGVPQAGNNVACAMTCHTALPAALAHDAVGRDAPALARLRGAIVDRVAAAPIWPSATPFYGAKGSAKARESLATEAVLNLASLAAIDGGRSSETSRALDAMWATMEEDGGFAWLDFGLEPFEHGEAAIGAALAVRALRRIGPDASADARAAPLLGFLAARLDDETSPLFDRAFVVWSLGATAKPAARARWTSSLLASQSEAGGWSWAGVGVVGKRGALQASDATPTAVAILGLCDATEVAAVSARRRALAWLAANQAADGAFPSSSPNRDRPFSNLVVSDAATGFAVVALTECAR